MSIQQDVLDTIGERGIPVQQLQRAVGNIGSAELDLVVRALMRSHRIRIHGLRDESGAAVDWYQLTSTRTTSATTPTPPPLSAIKRGFVPPDPLAPIKKHEPVIAAGVATHNARRPPVSLPSSPLSQEEEPATTAADPPPSTVKANSAPIEDSVHDSSAKPTADERFMLTVVNRRTRCLETLAALEIEVGKERKRLQACEDLLETFKDSWAASVAQEA